MTSLDKSQKTVHEHIPIDENTKHFSSSREAISLDITKGHLEPKKILDQQCNKIVSRFKEKKASNVDINFGIAALESESKAEFLNIPKDIARRRALIEESELKPGSRRMKIYRCVSRNAANDYRCNYFEFSIFMMISLVSFSACLERYEEKFIPCELTRSDILSMKTENALQYLLNYYDETCPPFLVSATKISNTGTRHTRADGRYQEIRDKFNDRKYDVYASVSKNEGRRASSDQYEQLVQLYDTLSGIDWADSSGWKDESIPICEWYGIECYEDCTDKEYTDNTCPVIGLWMGENNLSGDMNTFSPTLELFPFLAGIDFSSNKIYGSLSDFGMPNLSYLSFYSNMIFGTIPDFQKFPLMEYLEINDNKLEGTVPDFSGVPLITYLAIGESNAITGTLPDFTGLVNINTIGIYETKIYGTLPRFTDIPNVRQIFLFDNKLTGTLRDFDTVRSVTDISLGGNLMTGPIPDFRGIPNISELHISYNRLNGTIPDFSSMPNLGSLILSYNQLSGTIPDFSNIPSTESISLAYNMLSGTIPDFINIPNLFEISLNNNQLRGMIPDFSSIPNLFDMSLHSNQLDGPIPDFSNTPMLSIMMLFDNQLSGTIPDFSGVPSVTFIQLSSNELTGTMPDFSMIYDIIFIEISNNMLNGSIPDFSEIPRVAIIKLFSNQLGHTIPNFSGINGISYIDLSNNQLNGTVPDFLNIPQVRRLELYSNQLTGDIPDFSGIPEVSRIYLYSNRLSGAIPNFTGISKISRLYLYGNRLIGSVPDFGNISKITLLDISSNQLNGTIPNFSNIRNATLINLSNNKLSGRIPDFDNLNAILTLDLSGNLLNGSIPNFSTMKTMTSFLSYDNDLSGYVPGFENCPLIKDILVFRNKLSGSLPPFRLLKLQKLDISENKISGSLPLDWNIPLIEYIDLSRNTMDGKIPNYFEGFHQLKSLTLSHNQFTGSLPNYLWNLPNLFAIDLRNNSFSGDVGVFISPDPGYYEVKYETLLLDDNKLHGTMNWRIFEYLPNLKILSLKNNRIEKLDELDSLSRWNKMDLTGNPITGSIPESYNRFAKLEHLLLKNTNLNHGTANFLPDFMSYRSPFNLEDKSKLYICPMIVAKSGQVETIVDINPAYYDYEFCQCLPGYFGFGNNCVQCPTECECTDGVSLKNCHASPNIVRAKSLILCPRAESCKAFIPDKISNRNSTLIISELCEEGYEGHACSKCQKGYGSQGRDCVKCQETAVYSTLVLGIAGFFMFIAYLYFSDTSNSAKLRTIMLHMQTLSIISSGFIVSHETNDFINVSSSVGSIQFPNISCVFGLDNLFESMAFSFIRIPIFAVAGLIFYYFGSGHSKNKVVFITLNLLFFMYFSVTREVFGAFGCTIYDEGNGVWYLNHAPWIECSPASNEYRKLLGISIPVFIIFLAGFPLFVWRKVRVMSRNPGCKSEARYGFLYQPYKEEFMYWEFVIIARRIAFSFIISVIPYTSQSIFFLLLVIIIQLSIWMQIRYSPYRLDIENQLELSSLYLIFVSFFLALLSSLLGSQTWITVLIIALNLVWISCAFAISFALPFFKSNMMKKMLQEMKAIEHADF